MEKTVTTRNKRIVVIIILTIACTVLGAFSLYSLQKMGYIQKVTVRLGWTENGESDEYNYAVAGWENCLAKLDYDADIVFFGDSITRGSDFREYFDGVKICNLGYAGDTLIGMKKRVSMIAAVSPEKIFVLGGINSLRDNNTEKVLQTYSELLDLIRGAAPSAEVYVQSILPIATYRENAWRAGGICKNETIRAFNEKIEALALSKGMTYIDLYSVYELDGSLNPAYTSDGIHIYENYAPWANAIKDYIN